jgi:hypothetical protein
MRRAVWVLNAALMTASGYAASEADVCAGYKWDVGNERSLFESRALPLAAGAAAGSAALVEPNRLYALSLKPVGEVTFAVPPGKSPPTEGTYAGILTLKAPPGKYRVSIDQAAWVDIVSGGKLLTPADYEGVHGCSAPRKIVVFALDGGDRWTVQLSAADQATIRLSVTPAE